MPVVPSAVQVDDYDLVRSGPQPRKPKIRIPSDHHSTVGTFAKAKTGIAEPRHELQDFCFNR
jgi:hypothetical protein